jgi:hypothetical protein
MQGLARNKIADDQFYVGLLGILMTGTGEVRFAPMNGHRQFEPLGPKSAKRRHRRLGVT